MRRYLKPTVIQIQPLGLPSPRPHRRKRGDVRLKSQ
jgi:hypothetical protein